MEELLLRQIPHSLEAEQAVLGSMLIDPACVREVVEKLRPEQVDITLGNHPAQNNTLEKRQWMLDHPGENPFIDETGWHYFLSLLKSRFTELIELNY